MARWTSTELLPSQADQICAEVGNLALGVAMAGAMIPKLGWDHVLHRLGSADLDRIRFDFPDYPHPTLLAAIEISISTLSFNTQERYRELAVFAGQGPVPEAAIAALWATDRVAVEDVRDLLADYADRSLAWRNPDGTISLHDLRLDIATVQLEGNVGGVRRAHRRLLDGYRARCSNGWASGPNDGYFYQHLLHHLAHADLEHDRQKLLVDFDWLYAKLGATDITAVLADYSDLGQDEATVTVQETLQLAAPALAHDARQLPAQLVGRLDDHHDPAVRALVAQARRFDASPWLCPVTPTSFHRPGGPLKRVFPHPAGVNAVALTPDGRHVVFAGDDDTVRVWEWAAGRQVAELTGHTGSVRAVALTPDGRHVVSAGDDRTVRVWEWAAGREVAELVSDYPIFACGCMPLSHIVCGDTAGAVLVLELKGQQ